MGCHDDRQPRRQPGRLVERIQVLVPVHVSRVQGETVRREAQAGAGLLDPSRVGGRARVEPRGQVRMTAPVLFGQMHVAPAVSAFLQRFKQVQVELLLLDRVVNLVEEGIDLGIRIAHLADSSMIALPVMHVRRVVCASPALLHRVGKPKHPRQLSDRPCVRFSGINPGENWVFADQGREISVRIRGSFACNQAATAAQACADGLGFGMFLSYQIAPLVGDKRLQIVLPDFELPPLPVSLVYPESRLVSTRIRVLIDWLKQELDPRAEYP